jgi:hypothetical protein
MKNTATNSKSTLGRLISPIASFLKDKDFRTFSLIFAIIYFGQMYGKFGFLISQKMFPEFWLAVTSAIIFGMFAGTSTTAVIVHNRQETAKISQELLIFDILVSVLFYGDVSVAFFTEGKYGAMVAVLVFALYTSRLLYHLSEDFRKHNLDEILSKYNEEETNKIFLSLIKDLGITMPNDTPKLKEISVAIEKKFNSIQSETELLREQTKSLDETRNTIDTLNQSLEQITNEKNNLGISLREFMDKFKQQKEQNEIIKSQKEEIEKELNDKKNIRIIASKRGYITQLREKGKNDEADKLEKELEKEFGIKSNSLVILQS